MKKIKIFISHAHDDVILASRLVDLIRGCTRIESSAIRCSSVPGYGLPLTHISHQIRKELRECDIVIGLVTRNSIESDYVNFELGVGWYLNKAWALLGGDIAYTDIPGPLKEHNALSIANPSNLATLIKEICVKTSIPAEDINILNNKIENFIEADKLIPKATPTRKITFNLLSGVDAIFQESISKIKTAKRTIRATNFGDNSLPPPKIYTDAVKEKLTGSLKTNTPIEFKIIASPTVKLQERIDSLDPDVKRLMSYKIVDIKFAVLNVLIVDDSYASIAFPELSVDTHFRASLSTSDAPVVRLLIDWYDNFLWAY